MAGEGLFRLDLDGLWFLAAFAHHDSRAEDFDSHPRDPHLFPPFEGPCEREADGEAGVAGRDDGEGFEEGGAPFALRFRPQRSDFDRRQPLRPARFRQRRPLADLPEATDEEEATPFGGDGG